ncbi:MAG: hypothetical protein ABIN97_15800 [Ginsengibacter sp.]
MKESVFFLLILPFVLQLKAQPANCEFKQPVITIHFGAGNVRDLNTDVSGNYERIPGSCPNDGYYSYTPYTSDCFGDQWFTLNEDHTPGDISGNMMMVNSSHKIGTFFSITLNGLKGGTTYEFALWLMNVCKISSPCPFPLLPNITILLQTQAGKSVAQFGTGEVVRREEPKWTRYTAFFTTPPSETTLTLIMINNNPGGCGNDFALDDITFRECIKPTPLVKTIPVTIPPAKQSPVTLKPLPKKPTPVPVTSKPVTEQIIKPKQDSPKYSTPELKPVPPVLPPAPRILTTRENILVKQIETEAGEIRINLYDNGEIDGDTVSIYHNNVQLVAHARLSQKPISLRIAVDPAHPHHELIMVAENLGSIPPNTSLMIITAGTRRYEVFISSSEQKNAKVIFDLKE